MSILKRVIKQFLSKPWETFKLSKVLMQSLLISTRYRLGYQNTELRLFTGVTNQGYNPPDTFTFWLFPSTFPQPYSSDDFYRGVQGDVVGKSSFQNKRVESCL